MQYLQSHPEEANRLLRILEEGRAQGFQPVSMYRVKQPFDYDRR
jgi:hypothetical protein